MFGNWIGNGKSGYCGGGAGFGPGSIFGGLMPILFLILIGLVIYFIWRGSKRRVEPGHSQQIFEAPKTLSSFSESELTEELEKRKNTSSLEAEVAALKAELDSLKSKD